jgi:Na+-translocating ferredoxin:NAD+ oxidoreductase subunit B
MSDEVYRQVARVLDTLPSGFPPTESGVEIRLLKKMFEPDEAELFCKLRLTCETPEQVAARNKIPVLGLADKLHSMWRRGLLASERTDQGRAYGLAPWMVGLYEFQRPRMDKEFVELSEEYNATFGPAFIMPKPQLMQVVPVEMELPASYEALPYEKVSALIENGKSFAVVDCICRLKARVLGQGCDKPLEICMSIADRPGAFDDIPPELQVKVITKPEAYALLKKAEDSALVHLTSNIESGHWFICNCCGCCDGQLTYTGMGLLQGIINAHFYAQIDPELCTGCGVCADERCQVKAIEEVDGSYRVNTAKCIGCGLCTSACPVEAAKLFHKNPEELTPPAKDQMDWNEKRAAVRGVDFNAYK